MEGVLREVENFRDIFRVKLIIFYDWLGLESDGEIRKRLFILCVYLILRLYFY